MIREYIQEAVERAKHELIDNPGGPYYAEVPGLAGVWATGETLEQCRRNLADVIEGWFLLRLRKGLDVPPLAHYRRPKYRLYSFLLSIAFVECVSNLVNAFRLSEIGYQMQEARIKKRLEALAILHDESRRT